MSRFYKKRHTRVMRSSESKRGSGGLGALPSNKQGASVATDALLAKEQIPCPGSYLKTFFIKFKNLG